MVARTDEQSWCCSTEHAFRFPALGRQWKAVIESRATDQTGYVQPTKSFLTTTEGVGPTYHYNGIQSWKVAADGGEQCPQCLKC